MFNIFNNKVNNNNLFNNNVNDCNCNNKLNNKEKCIKKCTLPNNNIDDICKNECNDEIKLEIATCNKNCDICTKINNNKECEYINKGSFNYAFSFKINNNEYVFKI
jgi:hypothetical protein